MSLPKLYECLACDLLNMWGYIDKVCDVDHRCVYDPALYHHGALALAPAVASRQLRQCENRATFVRNFAGDLLWLLASGWNRLLRSSLPSVPLPRSSQRILQGASWRVLKGVYCFRRLYQQCGRRYKKRRRGMTCAAPRWVEKWRFRNTIGRILFRPDLQKKRKTKV